MNRSYRPQFAYYTPPGCRDLDFVFFFDGSNTVQLNQNFNGLDLSASTGGIPLQLDQDAPFYWRGIKVQSRITAGGVPNSYARPTFTIRFQDAYYNFLSDGQVPATQYCFSQNPGPAFGNQLVTGRPYPLEPEIYCPAGGVLFAFINQPTSGSNAIFPEIALYGVKRYKEC